MLRGSMVALVTPFKNGELDEAKVAELCEFHLAHGTHAIVPSGTTGESPTLNDDERVRLFRKVKATLKGKIPMIAGCGSNSTAKSIQTVKIAEECGADAALVVTPYYNKPTQEGLYRHYEAIAKATRLPIVLYNVPGRTSVNLLPETVARLSKIPNIAANKEASGSLDQITQIIATAPRVNIISGDDAMTFPILALGGVGVISVAANVIPRDMATMCDAFAAGDIAKAREIHVRFHNLMKTLFIETSPIPVKAAMKHMGLINGELRLPLCEISSSADEKLKAVLKEYGLLGKKAEASKKSPVKARK
jgi:4-hydroxy-tetrahydrodipicolinate synthase